MSKLSWGIPTIEVAQLVNGDLPTTPQWKALPTPKMDSTQLTASKGDEKTAQIEGGEIIDMRVGKTSYELVYELYLTTGMTLPFTDNDGVVDGNWAARITPEDATCEGVLLDNTVIYVEKTYSSADGIILKVTHKVLKPKTGNMVKSYTKPKA